jgi:hypothetical protein
VLAAIECGAEVGRVDFILQFGLVESFLRAHSSPFYALRYNGTVHLQIWIC